MRIMVNGEGQEHPDGMTVAALVAELPSSRGVAVARNREVVPRSAWTDTELVDGDEIELLTAMQGG